MSECNINDKDNEDKFEKKKLNHLNISKKFISFYIFFPIYCLLCMVGWLWTKLINKNAFIAKVFF